ncbi:MAG: hypothetical protein KDB00_14910 [Planctomycetales bacterium]|nr:hypothetical protein [Planctomycetales bacterium]
MSRKRRQPKKQSRSEEAAQCVAVETRPNRADATLIATESPLTSAQWTTLRKRILDDQITKPLESIFGDAVKRGCLYRWGIASLSSSSTDFCEGAAEWLTRIATGASTSGKRFRDIRPEEMIRQFQDSLGRKDTGLVDVHHALVWAAAMPGLLDHLDESQWWSLLGTIQEVRERLVGRDPTHPAALIGIAEIGLTLAWRLRALPSCRRLATSSRDALAKWCEQDDLAVTAALANPHHTRMVLASLLRIRGLVSLVPVPRPSKKNKKASAKHLKRSTTALSKAIDEIGVELTTWVAAMTRNDGSNAFSDWNPGKHEPKFARDDLGPNGLLAHAASLDRETLAPAIDAALGKTKTKGRLAWQVSLPESMLHDEDAKLVCMLPEWDVRRGRTIIDYRDATACLELMAGKTVLISGRCETSLVIDEQPIEAIGDWVATCEYSDDDVHYVELEQPHGNGYVLQRQVMVLREDRCFFFADAVVRSRFAAASDMDHPASEAVNATSPTILYQIRFPLTELVQTEPESQTNDLFLCDRDADTGSPRGRHALVMPLSACEWRNSHQTPTSSATMRITEDQHLLLASRGLGQLYTPLWIDLFRRRFSMKRTWRRLTVGEQLKLLPPQAAVAFRVQVGKSQWLLYRSMSPPAPRTFMGKHLIADFYCARFDAKEQSYEDLITVEDN